MAVRLRERETVDKKGTMWPREEKTKGRDSLRS